MSSEVEQFAVINYPELYLSGKLKQKSEKVKFLLTFSFKAEYKKFRIIQIQFGRIQSSAFRVLKICRVFGLKIIYLLMLR